MNSFLFRFFYNRNINSVTKYVLLSAEPVQICHMVRAILLYYNEYMQVKQKQLVGKKDQNPHTCHNYQNIKHETLCVSGALSRYKTENSDFEAHLAALSD